MRIEEIQHGGDHYKDQPKHLQPIWLGTALNLNPMEYSVLKYLLRHRKKGGFEDLKKMVHFAQMLMEHEYGVCPVVVYPEQDSPSDVSGEEHDEPSNVEADTTPPKYPLVGEVYKGKASGRTFRVFKVQDEYIWFEDCKSQKVHTVNWKLGASSDYERMPDEPIRFTRDKLPQVGDKYKRRDTGTMYRVLNVTDVGVVHMGKVENEQIGHDTDWELYFDQYERVTDET